MNDHEKNHDLGEKGLGRGLEKEKEKTLLYSQIARVSLVMRYKFHYISVTRVITIRKWESFQALRHIRTQM